MSTVPYFPLYVPDWISDTASMSPEAKGLFIDLLCYCWDQEGLSTDLDELAHLVRMDKRKFRRIWREVEHKFIETSPELLANFSIEVSPKSAELLRDFSKTSLKLWNPRLLKEMLQLSEIQEKRRVAGALGGLAKARNLLQQKPSKSLAYHNHNHIKEKKEEKKESYPQDEQVGIVSRETLDAAIGVSPQTPAVPAHPEKQKKRKQQTKPDWTTVQGLDLDNWNRWLKFRREVKRKPDYKTKTMAVKLASYKREIQIAAVEDSVANEYQGLFPDKHVARMQTQNPKSNGNGSKYPTPAQTRTWTKCWDQVHGRCGATWSDKKNNEADACHWCDKFKAQRANDGAHVPLSELMRRAQEKTGAQESGMEKREKTKTTAEGFKHVSNLLEGKK